MNTYAKQLVASIKRDAASASGLLIPVSGGSDSALCFWACCQALGDKVRGVFIGSNLRSREWFESIGKIHYLAERPDIARDRVALVGWSHGGSTALAAINVRDREVAAFRDRPGAPPFFRAAVAFYPGCAVSLRAGNRWLPGVPTRIHIGENDDWTPAKPCVELGEAMTARGEPLKVVVYPNSHHGFDAPDGPVVHRIDVPNGAHPGQGVHVGANPAARDMANAKVRAFLNDRLRGPDEKAH